VRADLGEDPSREGKQRPAEDEDNGKNDAPGPDDPFRLVQRLRCLLLGNALLLQHTHQHSLNEMSHFTPSLHRARHRQTNSLSVRTQSLITIMLPQTTECRIYVRQTACKLRPRLRLMLAANGLS